MTITELIRLRWPLIFAGLVLMLGLWTAAAGDQGWLRKGPDMDRFQQIIPRVLFRLSTDRNSSRRHRLVFRIQHGFWALRWTGWPMPMT